MAGPSIAVLLGGKHPGPEEDAPPSQPEMDGGGEDEFDDLDPKEIVEHKHASAEAFIKAIEDGSPVGLLKAFEALHGLDHAAWEHEGKGGKEPADDGEGEEEDEEAPPESA